MPRIIESPTIVEAAGNKPKIIEEYIGNINTQTSSVSIARMHSPGGWIEPGQTPKFDEYTVVLKGTLQVKTQVDTLEIKQGQAVIIPAGEWVQYSTPTEEGAEYMAICIPGFTPDNVHRDQDDD